MLIITERVTIYFFVVVSYECILFLKMVAFLYYLCLEIPFLPHPPLPPCPAKLAWLRV